MKDKLPDLDILFKAALREIPSSGIVGFGAGRTVNGLLAYLKDQRVAIEGVICAAKETQEQAARVGYQVVAINHTDELQVYIDSADEITPQGSCIKGGGGAMLKEKVLADYSKRFVCLVNESKLKGMLGHFPLPIEVISDCRSLIARKLRGMGAQPQLRREFVTDNQAEILDVYNLDFTDLESLEHTLNSIPGVIGHGLFHKNRADQILVLEKNDQILELTPI